MGKFSVQYHIIGTMTEIIEADTLEEAKKIAHDKASSDAWDPDPDEIDVDDIYVQEMHRVIRDGKPLWTTYVRATDIPSQP
jgi:hypothetical protein